MHYLSNLPFSQNFIYWGGGGGSYLLVFIWKLLSINGDTSLHKNVKIPESKIWGYFAQEMLNLQEDA